LYVAIVWAYNEAIHGEQFLLCRMSQAGEKLLEMAVNEVPCGHCRQFLKEVRNNSDVQIYIRDKHYAGVPALLPDGFGPEYVFFVRGIVLICSEIC
jgi:cytidine deaminase